MNNLMANYTGFNGRLNRQAWWISAIILGVVSIVLSFILGLVIPSGGADFNSIMAAAGWKGLIVWIIIGYPYLAITIKRRHDRNSNGYDAVGFWVLVLVYYIVLGLGLSQSIIGSILGLIFLIYGIYIFVVVGCLKGSAGPNQYGPDPLGG